MNMAIRLANMLESRSKNKIDSDIFRIIIIPCRKSLRTFKFMMNDGKLIYLRISPKYKAHRLPLGMNVHVKPKGEPDWYTSEFYIKNENDTDYVFYKANTYEEDGPFKLYSSRCDSLYDLKGKYPILQSYVDCVEKELIPLFEYWISNASAGYGLKD